jgi:hypothetical protein
LGGACTGGGADAEFDAGPSAVGVRAGSAVEGVVAVAAAQQVVVAAPVEAVAAAEPEDRISCLGADQVVGAVVAGDDVEALGPQVSRVGGAGRGTGNCTVSVNCRETAGTFGLGSETVTVNVNVPLAVGVPEISPLAGSRLRPGAGSRQ